MDQVRVVGCGALGAGSANMEPGRYSGRADMGRANTQTMPATQSIKNSKINQIK